MKRENLSHEAFYGFGEPVQSRQPVYLHIQRPSNDLSSDAEMTNSEIPQTSD